jgi:hypothetical protein
MAEDQQWAHYRRGGWIEEDVYDGETFRELMKLVKEHDDILRNWVKFLVGVAGAVSVALWSVVTFGERGRGLAILSVLISLFGVVAVVCLTVIIYRVRQWQRWFMLRAQHYQSGAMLIFPVGSDDHGGWVRRLRSFPAKRLDRAFRARRPEECGVSYLPSGAGPTFDFVAWMSLAFIFVLVAAGVSLSSCGPATSKHRGEGWVNLEYKTNSFHEITK